MQSDILTVFLGLAVIQKFVVICLLCALGFVIATCFSSKNSSDNGPSIAFGVAAFVLLIIAGGLGGIEHMSKHPTQVSNAMLVGQMSTSSSTTPELDKVDLHLQDDKLQSKLSKTSFKLWEAGEVNPVICKTSEECAEKVPVPLQAFWKKLQDNRVELTTLRDDGTAEAALILITDDSAEPAFHRNQVLLTQQCSAGVRHHRKGDEAEKPFLYLIEYPNLSGNPAWFFAQLSQDADVYHPLQQPHPNHLRVNDNPRNWCERIDRLYTIDDPHHAMALPVQS